MPTARIITDELIRSAAPNPAAVSNAKKICSLGEFSNLRKTADETLIFGECRGSGKNPYNTSADFSGETPVFRCSCPSRQFPCKHILALMMEWLSGKNFETSDIPEDIVQKREKAAKRGGAIFGLLHYIPQEHHILLCPMSLVHPYGITKPC